MIRSTIRWIKAVGYWLARAWRVWAVLMVVLAIMLIASLLPGALEDRVRLSGMTLELLGILTVAFGLKEKRILFQRPGLVDHFRSWWGSRPRIGAKPVTHTITGAGGIGISGAVGRASVWLGTPPDASLEARVATLEANTLRLREEQSEIAKELNEETRNRNEAVKALHAAHEDTAKKLRAQLETFGAGNLNIEAAGLFWLVLGVILATASHEIASAVKCLQ